MARIIPKLDSKTARDKLAPRHDPYWQKLMPGLFIGYHSSTVGAEGNWYGKWRTEAGNRVRAMVDPAAFVADKPGRDTKFIQAEKLVRQWHARIESGVTHKSLTVTDAVEAYLLSKAKGGTKSGAQLDSDRVLRNIKKNRTAFESTVLTQPLANIALDKLRSHHLTTWLIDRAEPKDADNPESIRRAQSTANRDWSRLRAALNYAYKQQMMPGRIAIDGVEPFRSVSSARSYLPSAADIAALFEVAPPEVVQVAKFLALTGCRPGEAFNLTIRSFNKAAGTIDIAADTKTGRRSLPLSTVAVEYITKICANKIGNALLFHRPDGKAWAGNEFAKAFREARGAAGLSDEFVAYSLRHLWITEHCRSMSLVEVAKIAGTSIKMIDDHYYKLQSDSARQQLDTVAELIAR